MLKKSKIIPKIVYVILLFFFIISQQINLPLSTSVTPFSWVIMGLFYISLLAAAFFGGRSKRFLLSFTIYIVAINVSYLLIALYNLIFNPDNTNAFGMLFYLAIHFIFFAPFGPLFYGPFFDNVLLLPVYSILIYIPIFLVNRLGKKYFSGD